MGAAALCVVLIGGTVALAQDAAGPRSSAVSDLRVHVEDAGSRLFGPDGAVLRTSPNPIVNARRIEMAGSAAWVAVWDEVQPSRQNQSFYRVSPDGQSLSRVRQTTYTIRVRYANFDPLADGEPAVAPELAAPASSNLYLVQFFAPPLEEMRQAIRALGGDVVRYMADHTHVVRMSAEARDQVAQLSYVRWVGPFHVAYKLSESIRSAFAVGLPESGTDRYSIEAFGRGPAEQEAVKALIEQAGGQVHFITKLGFRMEATLTPAQLLSVVRMNEVHYVHRWKLEDPEDMDIVRQISGTNFVEGATGFSGEGVRGESFDSGFQINHQDFTPTPIWRSATGTESHGTATYGVMFGTGFGNAQARGICPDLEQGFVTRYQVTTQFGGTVTRHSLYQAAVDPFGTVRIVNSTSSVGPYRTFFYDSISAEVDDYLFLYDLLSCQSMSNAGLIQDVRPQAWAKNIIGVGGIVHGNSLSRADDFSDGSTGPAEDGRIKPDLAHFYDNVTTTYSTSTTGYGTFGGTSNATPCTCGHAALFFQMWHEGVWMGRGGQANVFDSRAKMATAKAAMVNTAFRYDWNSGGPNGNMWRTRQGWGMVNVQTLYERRNETFIVDEEDLLVPFQTMVYQIQVNPGGPPLNITMVYTDLMGPTSASQHRINDLSLKVTAPDNTVYWGNNGLLAGNWSTPGGVSNTVDTVENVFIQNPTPGTWVVEVLGDEIVQDSHPETPGVVDADYALFVTGGTGQVGPQPFTIQFISGPTGTVPAGAVTDALVEILPDLENIVPGSEMMFYSYDGAPFVGVALTNLGAGQYSGSFPNIGCATSAQFYFQASGDGGTTRTLPSNAPASAFSFQSEVCLSISLTGGPTGDIPAGPVPDAQVQIDPGFESIVPGSETLHYRYGGGSFQTAPLGNVGGNNYTGSFPDTACGDTPEYYVSAQGSLGTVVTDPSDAPTTVFSFNPTSNSSCVCRGDADGNLMIDPNDIGPWVTLLLSDPTCIAATPDFCIVDVNQDLLADGQDVVEFTNMLVTGQTCAVSRSLTTLFASNNGGSPGGALYFDVAVGSNPITVTGFDTNTAEQVAFNFTVYTTLGTSVGVETNPAAWTQVATGTGQGMGVNVPSPVALNNTFTLAGNATFGIALVMGSNAGHDYTNGSGSNQTYSNGDVTFTHGKASNAPFTGSLFNPRVWNGTLYYDVQP